MHKKRIAALVAAASLAIAGCGSQAATTNRTDAAPQTQQDGQPPDRGMDFSALASELGVSVGKLQAAMQKNRPQPGAQPSGSADDMAANLAKELGLSESKVKAALEDFMPQGGPPNGQAPPSGTPSADTSNS